MGWLAANWKRGLMVVAVAVASLTADHTVAHKISDALVSWLPTFTF